MHEIRADTFRALEDARGVDVCESSNDDTNTEWMEKVNMKRRDFLKTVSFGAAAFATPAWSYARRRSARVGNPNIVYIMLDELGYFELSCM